MAEKLPSYQEVTRVDSLLKKCDDEIDALREEYDIADDIKDKLALSCKFFNFIYISYLTIC
jgi:hypothetical protein